jgi:hypothetical protein
MATLSSSSTDAEVQAAYDDNASYEEDASATKARAFVTACIILRGRVPVSAAKGSASATIAQYDGEIMAARQWIAANDTSRNHPTIIQGVGER